MTMMQTLLAASILTLVAIALVHINIRNLLYRRIAALILAVMLLSLYGLAANASELTSLPVNPDVTQGNIFETICVKGWTKTIRPPVSYTNQIKIQLMEREGLPLELIGNQILDHRIPLEAGGSPDDPRNLMLQDYQTSKEKDIAEHTARRLVCDGVMPLREAQQLIWTDWRKLLTM
jgi:hypothetical protein